MKKIAILGAGGYIGKNLVEEYVSRNEKVQLFLFSRKKTKISAFLKKNRISTEFLSVHNNDDFCLYTYDTVINATGVGDPVNLGKNPESVFVVTEFFDNLIFSYLKKNKKTLYINMSSGAVYGDSFSKEIVKGTKTVIDNQNLSVKEFYSIAKLNAEAKHRVHDEFNIVDVRVFAFFGKHLDLSAGFLMSEIVNCLLNNKVFRTNASNIVRDYVTAKDIINLIEQVSKFKKINSAIDIYSKKKVLKFELLNFLRDRYGLLFEITESKNNSIYPKNIYCSKYKKAEDFGYVPEETSLSGIDRELQKLGLVPVSK